MQSKLRRRLLKAASELRLDYFLGISPMALGLQTKLTHYYDLLSKELFTTNCESSPKLFLNLVAKELT